MRGVCAVSIKGKGADSGTWAEVAWGAHDTTEGVLVRTCVSLHGGAWRRAWLNQVEPMRGLKCLRGGSCQSAGAGEAVPDGDMGRQRTEGLGFRLLQPSKAARGVSIRGVASQSPNRRWWSGVERGPSQAKKSAGAPPGWVGNAPMVEPSEAGASE